MYKRQVHNKHVVQTLRDRGAVFVDETDQVPEGAMAIFSAHGVAPIVHEEAAARSLKTIDATCPPVSYTHLDVYKRQPRLFNALARSGREAGLVSASSR